MGIYVCIFEYIIHDMREQVPSSIVYVAVATTVLYSKWVEQYDSL